MFPFILSALVAINVNGLEAQDYKTRNRCHRWLSYASPFCLHLLLVAKPRTIEGKRRLEILLAPYARQIAECRASALFPDGWDRHPVIPLAKSYTRYLADAGDEEGMCWNSRRKATYYWVVSQLLQRRSDGWIVEQLNIMAWNEVMWCRWSGWKTPQPPRKGPAQKWTGD